MESLSRFLADVMDRKLEITKAKQQNIKIIGYTPGGYFPEELAYAYGVIPVALLRGGDHEAVTAAGHYLARFLDTFCRAQIGYRDLKEEPIYQIVDLVVAMITDNHIRSIAESWEFWTDVEVLKLAVPSNKTAHGFEYYFDALNRLKDKLEMLTGVKLSETKLQGEIILSNKIRDFLKEISLLRKYKRPKISGKDFIILNHASFFADRYTIIDSLSSILLDYKEKELELPRARVMLIGSTLALGDFKVIDILEENGAAIVFENFAEGVRHYSNLVDINGDPIKQLAHRYFMKRLPSAYAKPGTKERFNYFLDKAKEYNVNGIVWYSLLYRDTYDMEGFLFEKVAREAGLPLLKINSDYDYGEKEPLRTRIETFTEIIAKGGR